MTSQTDRDAAAPSRDPELMQGYFVPVARLETSDGFSAAGAWRFVRRNAWIVIVCTVVGVAAAIALSLVVTPVYRAETLLAPVRHGEDSNTLNALAGQIGGIASLAGVSLGMNSTSDELVAILKSREFTQAFFSSSDRLGRLVEITVGGDDAPRPDSVGADLVNDALKAFDRKFRTVIQNSATGLVTLRIDWVDPQEAADWANEMVRAVNERTRQQVIGESENRIRYLNDQLENTSAVELRKVLYGLIEKEIQETALAHTRTDFAFRVIDPAVAPNADDHVAPNRPMFVALGLMIGALAGLLLAALRESYRASSHDA